MDIKMQRRGWTDEELSAEQKAAWKHLTVAQIMEHKGAAALKIEAALQELYLATGQYFEVREVRYVRTEELNAKTQWTTRNTISVWMSAEI